MSRRGRPRSERAASAQIVHVKLRLYPSEDDDLIEFFSSIPLGLRAAMVKQALRSGGATACAEDLFDDGDVLTALDSFVD